MKDKNLVKLLKQNGWVVVRIQGSHHILPACRQTGRKTTKQKLFLCMEKMFQLGC